MIRPQGFSSTQSNCKMNIVLSWLTVVVAYTLNTFRLYPRLLVGRVGIQGEGGQGWKAVKVIYELPFWDSAGSVSRHTLTTAARRRASGRSIQAIEDFLPPQGDQFLHRRERGPQRCSQFSQSSSVYPSEPPHDTFTKRWHFCSFNGFFACHRYQKLSPSVS